MNPPDKIKVCGYKAGVSLRNVICDIKGNKAVLKMVWGVPEHVPSSTT